jgi:hypothetical protein
MDPGSNPGHRGKTLANNHLDYGTIFTVHKDTHRGTYSGIFPQKTHEKLVRISDSETLQRTRTHGNNPLGIS